MKQPIFIVFWLAMAISGFCQSPLQTPEGKALWKSIQNGKSDTNQVYRYLDYGFLWEAYSMDSAGAWYKKVNELSKRIGFPLGEIKYRTNYTYILNLQGRFQEGLELNLEALALAKKNLRYRYTGKCLGNLATSYVYLEKFDEALLLYQQAVAWFEKTNDKLNLARTMVKMESTYTHAGYFEKAYEAGKKALPIVDGVGDTTLIEEALNTFSTDCYNTGRFSEGLLFCERGYRIMCARPMSINKLENIMMLGSLNWKLGRIAQGLGFLREAYQFAEMEKAIVVQLRIALELQRIYLRLKNYSQASTYAEIVLELARAQGSHSEVQDAYLKLARIAELQKNFERAYLYYQAYASIRDSISEQKLKGRFLELDAKFQTSQKEKAILKLEKEKEVQSLNLSRRNAWLIASSVGLVLLALLVFYVFRNSRQKQKIQLAEIENLQKERQLIATNSLLKGQDEERSRLARDLHDGLGGMLSGLKFSLNTMKGNMILEEENATAFQTSIGQLDSVIAEMRRVAHSMMPEALVRFGLKEATQDLCDQVAKTSGLKVYFQSIGMEDESEKSISVALYRIEQELLNNILKHAEAAEITVQLVKDENQITLTVEDNGKGFDPNSEKQGAGLTSIRTRVEALGGSFDIQSKPGEGSSFLVEISA